MTAIWARKSGPTEYDVGIGGEEISVGWKYVLAYDGREHEINVEHAVTSIDLPDECHDAVASQGWSAVQPYLSEEIPPGRILVSAAGISPVYR